MATKPTVSVATALSGPQHYMPPTMRELRTQAMHRLQAGLFGLAAMLLLVGLANIIMDRARLIDASNGGEAPAAKVTASGGAGTDPLADIGVVPAADPKSVASPGSGTAPR
jgi:hypothetical protein